MKHLLTVCVLASCLVLLAASLEESSNGDFYLPIDVEDRQSWDNVALTAIGEFGVVRKARPTVPAHLHTAVDFKRPLDNYSDEPVFAMASGFVLSVRDDGPYAQIIIGHFMDEQMRIWSVYEHIAGIAVQVGDAVDPFEPIARFMNRQELQRYGWQFDHLHFEILKREPRQLMPDPKTPSRYFGTYSLECYDEAELYRNYFSPEEFFEERWKMKNDN